MAGAATLPDVANDRALDSVPTQSELDAIFVENADTKTLINAIRPQNRGQVKRNFWRDGGGLWHCDYLTRPGGNLICSIVFSDQHNYCNYQNVEHYFETQVIGGDAVKPK